MALKAATPVTAAALLTLLAAISLANGHLLPQQRSVSSRRLTGSSQPVLTSLLPATAADAAQDQQAAAHSSRGTDDAWRDLATVSNYGRTSAEAAAPPVDALTSLPSHVRRARGKQGAEGSPTAQRRDASRARLRQRALRESAGSRPAQLGNPAHSHRPAAHSRRPAQPSPAAAAAAAAHRAAIRKAHVLQSLRTQQRRRPSGRRTPAHKPGSRPSVSRRGVSGSTHPRSKQAWGKRKPARHAANPKRPAKPAVKAVVHLNGGNSASGKAKAQETMAPLLQQQTPPAKVRAC